MNDFGPHTAAVREVIDFACSGRVLSGPFRKEEFSEFDTRAVYSLDDVFRYRDDWVPRTEPWSTSEAWWDIRQSDAKALRQAKKSQPEYGVADRKIIEASDMIQTWLCRELAGVLPEEQLVDISDDFEMVIRYRVIFGRNNFIYEKLLRVYQASGYPVGWVGEFPKGQLVVFSR